MKEMSATNDLQGVLSQLQSQTLTNFVRALESCLSKIISQVAQREYKENSKINFSLLYFNIAQLYLALGKYDIALDNLDLSTQYQKVNLLAFNF